MKELGGIILALLMVGAIIFGIWAHFAGPCEMYKYSQASEIPGRCVMK